MVQQAKIGASAFSKDTLDLLRLLAVHGVRYLVVGGEAVIFHGYARVTGDVDLFYDLSVPNVENLFAALRSFWCGAVPGIAAAPELLQEGLVVQFGVPPNRIDLINRIDGVSFKEAWESSLEVSIDLGGSEVPTRFMGVDALIRNKRASGRPKDLEDLRYLEELP